MALAASFVLPLHRSGVNWRAAACLAAADLSSPPIMLANAGTSLVLSGGSGERLAEPKPPPYDGRAESMALAGTTGAREGDASRR